MWGTLLSLLARGPGRSRRLADLAATAAFVVGGLLLVWSAYIHFQLWKSPDYHSIAVIGPLFLFQSVTALVIGLGVIAVRRLWAAALGLGFAAATMGGFLISVIHGLFGFKDSWQATFAQQAFGIELATIVVLGLAAVLCLVGPPPHRRKGVTPAEPAP